METRLEPEAQARDASEPEAQARDVLACASGSVKLLCLGSLLSLSFPLLAQGAEPWSTYRGNAQRTGNIDNKPGPTTPQILWTHSSRDHFIASPVPFGGRLFISGLGAFNVSTFLCLDTDPKAAERVAWSKTTPYLKLPTVSSPAISSDKLVFGDGMHQTNDAVLHCLGQDKGMPLWQLPVLGQLVHLEGSPTVAGGRVYVGGGSAGVLCIDPDRLTLDGKEMNLTAIQKILAQRWKELQAEYEAAKKKDPTTAVPPDVDQLPRAAPRLLWQQGKGKWHVDAPVAVEGGRVFVASAFLDKEKLGDRSLYCLDARTGAIRWRCPLKLNPWGGPSVSGGLIVVGGSTIGYDPKELKGARGEIVAVNLDEGKVKWRKTVPGGIVSCVALADGLAVATATDGKIRAFDLATGSRRWIYDAKTNFFAPPAVAGGVVYAGDLLGVIHAVGLKDGRPRWTLDLAAAPARTPGMIYGGPAVQDGKIYVATCNLEGPHAGKATGVFCIGSK